MTPERDQKLVIAVVQQADADRLLKALAARDYGAAVLSSTGGFLRRGNATILTLSAASAVDEVLSTIRSSVGAHSELRGAGGGESAPGPHGARVSGGASVWVVDADLAGFVAARA